MTPLLIRLQASVFGHPSTPIVGPLDLAIATGDKVLLEGPSGCGKTSVLRGLLGFLTLLQGRYELNGEEASAPAIWKLRRQTGYISQELQLGEGSVRDWLPQDREWHEADFSRFHLTSSILEQSMDELSRGERQRLALVAMLAKQPSIYLLDEVTSALNEDLRRLVLRQIAHSEATVIAISHDQIWRESEQFRTITLPAPTS